VLKSGTPGMKRKAVDAILGIGTGSAAAVPEFKAGLKDADHEVGKRCAMALAKVKTAVAIAGLAEGLEARETPFEVKFEICDQIVNLGAAGEPCTDALFANLKGEQGDDTLKKLAAALKAVSAADKHKAVMTRLMADYNKADKDVVYQINIIRLWGWLGVSDDAVMKRLSDIKNAKPASLKSFGNKVAEVKQAAEDAYERLQSR
jgi:hypothetical protein